MNLDPDPAAPAAEPPLDRGVSPIAGAGGGRAARAIVFGGLLVGCAAFAAVGWNAERPRTPRPAATAAKQVVAFEPARRPTLADPGPNAPSLIAPGDERPEIASMAAGPVVPPLATEAPPGAAGAAFRAEPNPAPLLAYRRAPAAPAAQPEPPGGGGAAGRRSPAVATARAARLGDRNLLILAGTRIPCVLLTAIDSDTPGPVTCVVPRDVYSEAGTVVLLEKGARVLGEYRGGLRRGQRRLSVLWTRAVTPQGVAIDLASPAADPLGRAGLDGDLDPRFWDRFGAAALLTVVDGAAAALDRGRTPLFRLPSQAAAIAAEDGRGAGPVLRKPPGAEVSILAARDLDFSEVYALEPAR